MFVWKCLDSGIGGNDEFTGIDNSTKKNRTGTSSYLNFYNKNIDIHVFKIKKLQNLRFSLLNYLRN